MYTVDTAAVRRAWALDETIAGRYGVTLRPSGASRLLAHCPLPGHDHDRTPSFVVYRAEHRYHCFGCGRGGDVIDLVRTMEAIDFRAAVDRLTAGRPPTRRSVAATAWNARSPRPPPLSADPALREALGLAVAFYARRLRQHSAAQAYLRERGLSPPTITGWGLGVAGGLTDYLAWLRRPRQPFSRLGLLCGDGQERLGGRITIPELVDDQPVWLTGRLLPGAAAAPPHAPRYESLPGPRPLLGFGRLPPATRTVVVTEGVFDLLLLAEWGYPAVALGGASPARSLVQALTRFDRVVLLLDSDAAGQRGTAELVAALGARTVPIRLPAGVKDVADLAMVADGRQRLAAVLRPALGGHDLVTVDLLNRDGRLHDDHD